MHTKDEHHGKLHWAGALLVHGLHDNLRDMEELTGFLGSNGIVTLNVFCPGHGTHVRGMLPVDWPEWLNVVYKELRKLKQWCKYVFLIGHSLGGALCLRVAASEPVAGIVTMCTPVYMYPWMLPAVRLIKHLNPVPPIAHTDLHGYEAQRDYKPDVYRRPPLVPGESTLHYLPSLRTALPSVTAPALIMTAIHDHVVPARDAQAIYRLISSQEKYLVKFRQSYRLLMRDHDREEVFARTLDFIQSHARRI
jgi:carboxylesterase